MKKTGCGGPRRAPAAPSPRRLLPASPRLCLVRAAFGQFSLPLGLMLSPETDDCAHTCHDRQRESDEGCMPGPPRELLRCRHLHAQPFSPRRLLGLDARPFGLSLLLDPRLLGQRRCGNVSADLIVDLLAPRPQQLFTLGKTYSMRQQKVRIPAARNPSACVRLNSRASLEEASIGADDISRPRPAASRALHAPHEQRPDPRRFRR